MRMRGLALAALLWSPALSSCATDATALPPVKEYTKAEQAQACAELRSLCPAAPSCGAIRATCPALVLPVLIDDYKLTRDAIRAARP